MGACEAHMAKACPEVCLRFEHRPQIQLSSRTYTLPMLHHDDTPLSAMLWRSPEGATDSAETEQAMLQEVSWGSRSLTLLEHRSRRLGEPRLGGFDIAKDSQVGELFGKRPSEGSGGLCASGGRKVLHAEFRKCCDRQSTPHPSQVAADPFCIQGADRSEAWEEAADRFCMEAADRTEPWATLSPSTPTSLVMSRASSEESLDAFVEKIVERAQQVRTRPLCERATSEDGSFDSPVVLEEGTAVDS
mmetsp:Transcript_95838/g.310618  ORF Transcript_95838/g.310618 Transcript_95838/m.310618 type:complete len:246 (+) Transcript_95838:58-795(+)